MLYARDSIGRNVVYTSLERASDTTMKMVHGNLINNDGDKSFESIIEKELEKKKYGFLVIQGGSDDLSAMETNDVLATTEYKKNVAAKATAMIRIAEKAVESQPSISKVLVMGITPRQDFNYNDPHQIKPELAKCYNKELKNLLCDSVFKDKIVIGEHMEVDRNETHNIYGYGRYSDGIHLNGIGGKYYLTSSIRKAIFEDGIGPFETNEDSFV